MRRAAAALAVALAVGCGSEPPGGGAPPPPSSRALASGVVARVGGVDIRADLVARIAAAQGIDPRSARDLAIHDALLALDARARGVADRAAVSFDTDAVLARTLRRALLAEARAAGPATDAELTEVTARHRLDVDRPEASMVVHAVLRMDEKAPADKRAKALELGEAIRRAVLPVADVARAKTGLTFDEMRVSNAPPVEDPAVAPFRAAAEAVEHPGFELVVEMLPPMSKDGHALLGSSTFDETFAAAALALRERGDISRPVTTQFGVHVLMELEHVAAQQLSAEERRARFAEEIASDRAHRADQALLDGLRQRRTFPDDVDALLGQVAVDAP